MNGRSFLPAAAWLYVRHGLALAADLVAARFALAALGADGFGTYAAVTAIALLGTFFCGALGETFRKYLSEAACLGAARAAHVFSDALGLTVAFAGVGLLLSGAVGGLWVGSAVAVHPHACAAFACAAGTAALTVLCVPFEAQVVASERNGVFALLGLCEAAAIFGAIGAVRALPDCPGVVVYAAVRTGGQLLVLLVLAVRCRQSLWTAVRPRGTGIRRMLKFFVGCAVRAFSTELKYRGTETALNAGAGPLANAAWRVAMQVGGVFAMVIGDFQTAVTPRLMKLHAQGNARGLRRLLVRAEAVTLLVFLALAVPVGICAPSLVAAWLGPDAPPATVAFIRAFAVHFLFDALSAPLHVVLTTGRDPTRYQLGVSLVMGSGFGFAVLALALGLPLWCVPAGVALSNALAFAFRLHLVLRRSARPRGGEGNCVLGHGDLV